MSDSNHTFHEWGVTSWEAFGDKPQVTEWGCVKCGLELNNGDVAKSKFCDCSHEEYECTSGYEMEGKDIWYEITCVTCGMEGRIYYGPDGIPLWEDEL
jgi:hypothetical protein